MRGDWMEGDEMKRDVVYYLVTFHWGVGNCSGMYVGEI
jgi:hypothetical protein